MGVPFDRELLARQVAEFQALQSVYSEPGAVEEDSEGLLQQVQQALECEPGIGNVAPQLSGRVRLTDVAAPGSEPLSLHFSLPRGYPSSAVPVLRVECGAKRDTHDALAAAVADCAREAAGSETLLLAVERLREAVASSVAPDRNPDRNPDPDPDPGICAGERGWQHQAICSPAAGGAPGEAAAASANCCSSSRAPHAAGGSKGSAARDVGAAAGRRAAAPGEQGGAGPAEDGPIGRRVIWFHHIKSPTKRKRIVEWAEELDIGGYSVIGYPGVIICEGVEEDIAVYVKRIRALRWLAMALRAQETAQASAPGGAGRCFTMPGARPLRELAADGGLSVLGAECRAVGLEHLFKAALKIGA